MGQIHQRWKLFASVLIVFAGFTLVVGQSTVQAEAPNLGSLMNFVTGGLGSIFNSSNWFGLGSLINGQSGIFISGLGIRDQIENVQDWVLSVTDRASLNEKLNSPDWTPLNENITNFAHNPPFPSVLNHGKELSCTHAEEDFKLVLNAVERAVKFYETHISELVVFDTAVGLQVLQGVLEDLDQNSDRKSHKDLLTKIPPLVSQIIEQALKAEVLPVFQKQIQTIGSDKDIWKRPSINGWKPVSVINNKLSEFHTIGFEKEHIWGLLTGQCQEALISNCQVPYVCQRTFLDPAPQSQYMLTHQALFLHFAKQKSCDKKDAIMFNAVEERMDRICTKVYQEASLIAHNDFPVWARDLFAEQVAVCSLAGYPNFLRRSWLQRILSWQSVSESGCFYEVPLKNVSSLDKGITQTSTTTITTETEIGSTVSTTTTTERCLPHLTSVSLTSLALQLSYLHEKCLSPLTLTQKLGVVTNTTK